MATTFSLSDRFSLEEIDRHKYVTFFSKLPDIIVHELIPFFWLPTGDKT